MSSPHLRLHPDQGKRIRIYRNGEVYHKGITIVLNSRQIHDINSFLDAVSEKIGLVLGAKRLYTLDGTPVTSTNQLEHNKEYVASSGPFTPLPYGQSQSVRSTPDAGRRGSISAGNRFKNSFGSSSSTSKKSAPGSLLHQSLRPSRSTEPRRGAPRSTTAAAAAEQPARVPEALKKGGGGGDEVKKKRSKKKAKEKSPVKLVVATPPVTAGGEEEEEEEVGTGAVERNKTEFEVVEHREEGEVDKEEAAHDEEEEKRAEEEEGEAAAEEGGGHEEAAEAEHPGHDEEEEEGRVASAEHEEEEHEERHTEEEEEEGAEHAERHHKAE